MAKQAPLRIKKHGSRMKRSGRKPLTTRSVKTELGKPPLKDFPQEHPYVTKTPTDKTSRQTKKKKVKSRYNSDQFRSGSVRC